MFSLMMLIGVFFDETRPNPWQHTCLGAIFLYFSCDFVEGYILRKEVKRAHKAN